MPQALLGMEVAELREALGASQPEFRARQIYHALYSEQVGDLVEISTLPALLRRDLAASHTVNLPNVIKATRLLTDPNGVGLSPRRITLSTSGIIPKIVELGAQPVRPKLAISLNASTEEQRQKLMPITRKYHLVDLMEACKQYPLRPWEKLTFEYALLKGVNDSDADARRVIKLLANLNCKVNLIAF